MDPRKQKPCTYTAEQLNDWEKAAMEWTVEALSEQAAVQSQLAKQDEAFQRFMRRVLS